MMDNPDAENAVSLAATVSLTPVAHLSLADPVSSAGPGPTFEYVHPVDRR